MDRLVYGLQETSEGPRPAFQLKVRNFSLLASSETKYESGVFEAGDYKWKLILYPNGVANARGCISLYLRVEDTESFRQRRQVRAIVRLYIYKQRHGKYAFQETKEVVFSESNKQHGFHKFMSLSTLNNPANAYVMNGCYVFAAEVRHAENRERFYQPVRKRESLTMLLESQERKFTFQRENFSRLHEVRQDSPEFTIGERTWRLWLYPKGDDRKGEYVSIYLNPQDIPAHGVYAKFVLRVLDQQTGNHIEQKFNHWYLETHEAWGEPKFMPLRNVRAQPKRFLVNDTLKVEVEFKAYSVMEDSS